jgi:ABC-2 type transport system permease protein
LAPRLTAPPAYGLVLAAYLLDFVGGFLDLPEAVLDISPLRHLAAVPAVDIDVGPALIMLLVAVLGMAVGLVAFRRHDLQEA